MLSCRSFTHMRRVFRDHDLKLKLGLALWLFMVAVDASVGWASDVPAFTRDVLPMLTKAGCNSGACHGSLQGRGGLALSLLGYDSAADYEALFLAGRGRRVLKASAGSSLLLLKATGSVPHGGGARFKLDSESARLLGDFIRRGLPTQNNSDPQVVRMSVEPTQAVLAQGDGQALRVFAEWNDGIRRDVTRWALFDSRDSEVVSVSRNGNVLAARSGKSPVTVRFAGHVASVDVTVPYGKSSPIIGFKPSSFIDNLAMAEWQRVGVNPAPLASDNEFVRRVYLDVIGTLPQPDEVHEFVSSSEEDKRAELIDALLERPEYVDYWSLKWSDLLRVHRRYVGDKGLETFRGWIRRAVRENRPLNEMVHELITAQGDLFSSGPVGFYFVDPKPEELAETTSQVFLGVRLQCARCHHHPLEVWSQDDYYGLAAFFTRMKFKDAGKIGVKFGGPKSLRTTRVPNADRKLQVASLPRVLGGSSIQDDSLPDVRKPLTDWIVAQDNPYFARNFANRYWAWLNGQGIIEPVDDLRATNPPSNPELMQALEMDFIQHGFDAKHLIRTICNSRVYQLASDLNPKRDRDGRFFTHRVPRRMQAEVLLDAICHLTGVAENFNGQPKATRAIALPDPSIGSQFLMTFGRPLRNNACECARSSKPDLSQALHLVNDYTLNAKITDKSGRLGQMLAQKKTDTEIMDELYLAAFSRLPTSEERNILKELLTEIPKRDEGWQDVLWTLMNSSEFVFNH